MNSLGGCIVGLQRKWLSFYLSAEALLVAFERRVLFRVLAVYLGEHEQVAARL